MKELTVDEAIDETAGILDDTKRFNGVECGHLAHLIGDVFSRVRPAETAPEVAYDPCELREGLWSVYDERGKFVRYRDGANDGPTGKNYRYVRVGDVPACPPPKPAPLMPPKPELTCYQVSVGRNAGLVFWATTSELGVLRDAKTGDVIAVEFCEKVEATHD